MKPRPIISAAFLASLLAGVWPAFATAMRPFAVGGGEGGGGASGGVTGWLLNEQSRLTHLMSAHLTALSADSMAIWGLVGLGFAYGVFHAAGPGHGKAVIASYMMANDRALRRGIALAFLAALMQGAVAVALVGVAAFVFNATAAQMNRAADALALTSYVGIAVIGAWLVWKKGRAMVRALRRYYAHHEVIAEGALYAGAPWRTGSGTAVLDDVSRVTSPATTSSRTQRAVTTTRPIRACSARGFPGAARRRPSWRRARGPARAPFWFSSFLSRGTSSRRESRRSSQCRWARR